MKLFFGFTLLLVICKLQTSSSVPPFLCQTINTVLAGFFRTHNATITLAVNGNIPTAGLQVDMFIEEITITGLESLRLDCGASYADLENSNYVCHVEGDIQIDISYYNMSGFLDTVEIYGEGPSYINIENFTAAVYGPTDDAYMFLENSTMLDLWIYRWTVNFEGVMPGTDMGYLFNEFLSMVGPETIDAIDIFINNRYAMQLTKFVNLILAEASSALGNPTKPNPSETTTTAPPETTAGPSFL